MKYLISIEETKAIAATAKPMEQRAHVRFILKANDCQVLESTLDLYAHNFIGPLGYVRADVVALLLQGDVKYNNGQLNDILENNRKVDRGTLFTRFIEVTDELDIARDKSILKPKLLAQLPAIEEDTND